MTVSIYDATILRESGFTEAEIMTIANAALPNGNPQPPINLGNEYWREACEDHARVMDAYYRVAFQAVREDRLDEVTRAGYEDFINQWYREVVRAADPWVWIDQFYLRVQLGKVNKLRYLDAKNKVDALKNRIR